VSPARLLGDVSAASVVMLISITYALSFGALIFSGELAEARPIGFAAALIASVVLVIVTVLMSSLPFVVAGAESNVSAVMAVAASTVAMQLHGEPEAMLPTTLAGLMLTSVLTGVFLVALGTARAGQLVRFVPYPVIAGFLGGTGWFLSVGGLRVGTGVSLSWTALANFVAVWPQLIATVLVAILAFLVLSRFKHFMALPLVIVAAVIAHHIAFRVAGLDLADARAAGWLIAMPDRLPLSYAWDSALFAKVDWLLLASHWGDLLAIMLVTAITILINVSGLEVATARDADLDRDLRASGWAAMASGLAGGLLGYTSISRSLVLLRAGATTRFAGVLVGLLLLAVMFEGAALIEMVPPAVLGGVLLYVGVELMRQWIVRSRLRLSLVDWLTVVAIFGVAVQFGFVMAVFAGLLAGCASFAASYSRIAVVRLRYRGDAAESNVERAEAERALLREHGREALVMHLQGYLFFGTANTLLGQIRREIEGGERTRYLLLDFRDVDDIDCSAAFSFERLRQLSQRFGFALLYTSLSDRLIRRLKEAGAPESEQLFATLDHGLEWCEEQILARFRQADTRDEPLQATFAREFDDPAHAPGFMRYLEPMPVVSGSTIMTQGDASDDLYFLESGRVTVLMSFSSGVTMRVRTMGPGTMIGEVGFYLRVPRTATVIADRDSVLYRLTRDALARLDHEAPAVAADVHRFMARRLSARLADKDRLLAAFVER
jgi:sulfate permease, SulP family